MREPLKAVRDEITNNLAMKNMRQNEINTEKHFSVIAEREHGRLESFNSQGGQEEIILNHFVVRCYKIV